MMHLKFPLPAGYFPRFELTPDETLAYKELVTDLVKDTRREYESYVTTQQRHVDGRKWKLAKSKDKLHFYKRRSEYGAAAIGLTGRQNARHGSSSSSSNGGSFDLARSESESSSSNFSQSTMGHTGGHNSSRGLGSSRSRVGSVSSSRSGSVTDGEAPAASAASSSAPTLGGIHKRLLEPTLLATGVLEGTVDDLVYAFHEPTAEDTKGVAAMVGAGDALVDAVVLHTIKCTKTTYLGLKWKLCRTPGGNRDFCFLEYVGVANDAKGQRYGFKVLESVKLRNCPPFADNSIIRTDVSFCYLFRESGTPGIVDVYMQGAFDSSGDAVTAGGVGDARSTMDMLLEVESCMEIAESKKLAALVAKQAAAPPRPKNGSALCSICRAKPGMLSSHLNCQGCGAVICTKCRMKKTVMTSKRGVSTKLKISCCKICLVNVKETSPFEGEPINTQPPLRALTRKPSATSMRSASNAEQLGGLESTQELALALPVATIANVPPHHLQQQQQHLMLQQQQQYKHHPHQQRVAGSLTDTEYSGSMQSWQSSSVSSSYSDLDDSYGSPPSSQLVVAHKMPAVAESPRARLQYHQQQQQQQQPYTPQYASLADGTMVAAPPGSNGRRMTPPPPPMPPHMAGPGGAPDMNQHRMGLYNQMLELQMQAERAYNLANQNATFMQRQ